MQHVRWIGEATTATVENESRQNWRQFGGPGNAVKSR